MTDPVIDAALALVCSLDECGRARRAEAVAQLVGQASAVRPLPGGLRLQFPHTLASADAIAEFVRAERDCCAQFTYAVTPAADGRTLDLDITGRGGDAVLLRAAYLWLAAGRGDRNETG